MELFDRQKHWENIFKTKELQDVSWFQPVPETSLKFFRELKIPLDANIIDIGGGNSFLVDNLIDLGYQNITVLDISSVALEKTKLRLGENVNKVKWIIGDVTTFIPTEKYDFWHDRAAFHFLTEEKEINAYLDVVQKSLNKNGALVIGTFTEEGPKKCSGIEIKQYSENSMTKLLTKFFHKIKCIIIDHETPVGTIQNFIFCSFRKIHDN